MAPPVTSPAASVPSPGAAPRRGFRPSLGFRLTLLLAFLLIVAGAVATWLSAHGLGDRLLEETRGEVLRMSDTIKRSTRYDMMTKRSEDARSEDVRQAVQDIGRQPGIEHVRIYNKEGKIVYSSRPAEESTVVDMTAEACYQCHAVAQPLTHLDSPQRARIYRDANEGRVLAAIDVIYNEPGCSTTDCHLAPEQQSVLGVVDVGVSLREIDARIAEAGAGTLAFALGATALVCGLIGLFVYGFVTRPVRRLLRGIRRVAHGELEASLPVASSDEIGELAGAFNQMTGELRKARDELRSWGETLESQVEQRTRDLKLAQAQVVRAEKLSSLGMLAAGVAHELNSPLTGILTFSHLMLQDAQPGTRQHEDLQLIVNETQRCAAIIRQLLQFSRESGPDKRPQDIVEIVRRALALVEHQALFHKVKVETRFGADVPPIHCDGNQLQQVFLNMLINAAEAMPEGGAIAVRVTRTPDNCVAVEFEDTGIGIPPENLVKVFDPFFTSKDVGKGTGLGLSVSYGIVRRHGGTISVHSTPGEGTRFTIRLPLQVHEETAP